MFALCVNFQCAKQCLFFFTSRVLKIKINGSNRPNNRMNNQRHKTNNKLYLFIFLPLRLLNYRRWRLLQLTVVLFDIAGCRAHVYGGFWLTKCHSSKLRRDQIQFLNWTTCCVYKTHHVSYMRPSEMTLLNSVPWFLRFVDNWREASSSNLLSEHERLLGDDGVASGGMRRGEIRTLKIH